jgi:hypothetical protein
MTMLFRVAPLAAVCCCLLPGQNPQPEMSATDSTPTFQSRVNLVTVPVVVRNKDGKAVGNLIKEDFQLFDRGKPQIVR